MYEYYIAHMEMHHFDIFTIEDIDKAFEEISPMNFLNSNELTIKDTNFTITASSAGYSLGGAVWKIDYLAHKFVYAIDVNDKNENISEPLRTSELRDAHYLITNTYIAPSIDGRAKTTKIQPQLSIFRLKYHINKTLIEHLKFDNSSIIAEQQAEKVNIEEQNMENLPIGEVLLTMKLTGHNPHNNSKYP